MPKPSSPTRCEWPQSVEMIAYHDTEWGVPVHDDRALFELLTLEGAQAGLSWAIVLAKRETYRAAFDHFDPGVVANYDAGKLAALQANPGVVRNRLKLASTVTNARAVLAVQREFGSFDRYVWSFVAGRPLQPQRRRSRDIPVRTVQSDALSRDLRQRGFKFVGTTICYAFMQAAGLVNDHLTTCPQHARCARLR